LSGEKLPGALKVTAVDPAGVIMAITHTTLPFTGVQFHPESVMTGDQGFRILSNWLAASEMNK
jgi:anthranilate/para-aminobenzoate synthase component II